MAKKIFITILAAIAILSAPAGMVQAVGLSVAPSEVFVDGNAGRAAMAYIKVTNTSNAVALFEAYPDDLRPIIEISPASFTLQGGESREIAVTVDADKSGRFETMVSIVSTPMSSEGFRAGAGIKVPLRLNIADGETGLLANISSILGAGALPIGIGLIALILFLRFFKVSPRRRQGE